MIAICSQKTLIPNSSEVLTYTLLAFTYAVLVNVLKQILQFQIKERMISQRTYMHTCKVHGHRQQCGDGGVGGREKGGKMRDICNSVNNLQN